jgi:hypothetical protein
MSCVAVAFVPTAAESGLTSDFASYSTHRILSMRLPKLT